MNFKPKYTFFWDIGNVLIKFVEDEFVNYLKNNKLGYLSGKNFIKEFDDILSDSFVGNISVQKTWSKLFALTNVNKHDHSLIKNKYKLNINSELINYIKEKLSYNDLGLISDLHQIAFQFTNEYCRGFFKVFNKDLVYLSNRSGLSKNINGREYLEHIFDSIKEERKRIIFIDDEYKNVVFAKSLGVNAILFPKIKKMNSWRQSNREVIDKILIIINKQNEIIG